MGFLVAEACVRVPSYTGDECNGLRTLGPATHVGVLHGVALSWSSKNLGNERRLISHTGSTFKIINLKN